MTFVGVEDATPSAGKFGAARSAFLSWGWAAAVGVVALIARLPALHQPLDRDMGAHAAIGAFLRDGLLPYVDVIDNKQPLPYVLYAALDVVRPYSTAMIRAAAAVVAAMVVMVVVGLGRRLIGLPRASMAALIVAVAGASRYVEGVDLNTEHLLVLTGTVAVMVPLAFPERRGRGWSMLCGALVGLSALTKAPGALLALPVLVALLWPTDADNESPSHAVTVGWFLLGGVLPAVPLAVWYGLAGELDALVYWNVIYNFAYTQAESSPWWRWFVPARQVWPVVVLAALGGAFLTTRLITRGRDRTAWVIMSWLLAAYVGARIGHRDFRHYFAPLVVPGALGMLVPVAASMSRRAAVVTVAAATAVAGFFAVDVAGQYGSDGDELAIRLYRVTQAAPWIWHEEVGSYLRANASPDDELYVVGNEPGFYWSSGLRPANPHIAAFPSAVLDGFEREVAADLEADPPRYLVQPYGHVIWPNPVLPLSQLGYEVVAEFGTVLVMRLPDHD